MTVRPSGTVTFLFTDIEGSTRRWEADADAMRADLAAHDAVLRSVIEGHGGWLFKHTGDGVCAAFASAGSAVDAAVGAQRMLGLPVRMGIATGEAEQRGEDYFGPALNRAARVMAVGHGGQILVSGTTAALVAGVDLWDLGEHRLRDLTGVERLFQVRADGLALEFPALKTLDAVLGNLPVRASSFVGRDRELAELVALVRANRLVTLTGVGGVGKTRLAIEAARELAPEFPDGVWLVELAAVGDPASVPDAVVTALGVIPQAGLSLVEAVAQAMAGRRALLVVDNCEHVIDAAGGLIETILGHSPKAHVIATSREGLRVASEQLWSVPSLGVGAGEASDAVQLFVERAQAVNSAFALGHESDVTAVTEICVRLDGIALAIELAAARIVSMSPTEIRDRLNDRFRLLSGGRRGVERHQTLRHAVDWSYELLDEQERLVLQRCAVFAGGFDLEATLAVVADDHDEYALLDVIDSLVRKSLFTATRFSERMRYGMLETIRQFAEDQLVSSDGINDACDRHARYFGQRVHALWGVWDGPGYDAATEWAEVEFANLRAGFRWAADQGDLVTATTIAAHSVLLAFGVNDLESVGWAEEILPAAAAARVPQLPRLYAAATLCMVRGRTSEAVEYAQAALLLAGDPAFDPFDRGWCALFAAEAYVYDSQMDRAIEIAEELAAQPGAALVAHSMLTVYLPFVGRFDEAMTMADGNLTAVRRHANPMLLAYALMGTCLAFTPSDPVRALIASREGLDIARAHGIFSMEPSLTHHVAALEAIHGDLETALQLFDDALRTFHQSGNVLHLRVTFVRLVNFFDRIERPEVAATLCGVTTSHPPAFGFRVGPRVVEHVRAAVGLARFDECVAAGTAMELGDAVAYAREQIRLV